MKFIVIPLCLTLALLELSTGHNLQCSVTQAGGLTTYRVPDFQHSQCQCSWSNATNFPLANHGPKTDDRVVNKSDTTLITSECITKISYRRSCISEGGEREATCETNCTDTTGPSPLDGNPHPVWTGVTIALSLVVVGLMLGGLTLYCRCRGPASSIQSRPCLTAVKIQSDPVQHCQCGGTLEGKERLSHRDVSAVTSGVDAPN